MCFERLLMFSDPILNPLTLERSVSSCKTGHDVEL